MPSFRATIAVQGLRAGHAPEEVMDAAVEAVASSHVVEAHQLDVVAGVPRITIRFLVEAAATAEENHRAWLAATAMEDAVSAVAFCTDLRVLRRSPRARWLQVSR